jgi:hypothetical protein
MSSTATALVGIWVFSGLIAVFSPDLVSGTEQEHIPIAAITIWFYAGLATAFVLLGAAVRGRTADAEPTPLALGAITAGIWFVVAAASIFAPVMETGSDPTTVPIAALVAPIVGLLATAFISVFAAGGGSR